VTGLGPAGGGVLIRLWKEKITSLKRELRSVRPPFHHYKVVTSGSWGTSKARAEGALTRGRTGTAKRGETGRVARGAFCPQWGRNGGHDRTRNGLVAAEGEQPRDGLYALQERGGEDSALPALLIRKGIARASKSRSH